MACSTQTLKIFTLLWVFLYTLLASAVIGIGIYIVTKFDHFHTAAIVIIGLGIVALFLSFFGILSALRENSCLLKTFAAFLIFLTVLLVLTVGFFWIFKTQLFVNVDKTFDKLWREQPVPIKPGNASQIASIERWLECCGNSGPSDYVLPPYSCYNSQTDKLNMDGCRQKFLDYISERWIAFNIFALVLAIIELICATFAYVLANSIVNRWRRSKYYPK
ncbi:tetraspanin 42Eg isoform 2-T2 [Glossina fuscipes fuscipes]